MNVSADNREAFGERAPCAFCDTMNEEAREYCVACGASLPPLAGGVPWEKRGELGFVNALLETAYGILRSPMRFFARARGERRHGGALLFSAIVDFFATLIATIWTLALFGDAARENIAFIMKNVLHLDISAEAMESTFRLVAFGEVLFSPILSVITLYITAGILYLMMAALVIEGRRFSLVLSLAAFAKISQIAFLLPEIGGLIASVLGIIFTAIAFAARFRVTWGKAVFLALAPSIIAALFFILAGSFVFGSAQSG